MQYLARFKKNSGETHRVSVRRIESAANKKANRECSRVIESAAEFPGPGPSAEQFQPYRRLK